MFKRIVAAIAITAVGLLTGVAQAKPPMEAFGDMPSIRAVSLSPDGSRAAYILRENGIDVLVIHDFVTKTAAALAKVDEIRARDVQFIGNDYVVLIASKDTSTFGYSGRFEFSAALAFNLKTGTNTQLLRGTEGIHPAQSGLGRIIGLDPDGQHVLMPAYMIGGSDSPYDLLRVPLNNGRGSKIGGARGSNSTIDWLVDNTGKAIAREDFSERNTTHQIKTRTTGAEWKTIYETKAPLPAINLVGISPDGKSLIVVDARESEFMSLYSMSMETGEISPPLMQREDAEVAGVVSGKNRVVHGVRYSGMFPTYEMFDPEIEAAIKSVQSALAGSAVYLDSWTDDWSKMLFFVEGGKQAEQYLVYDRATQRLTRIASARSQIKEGDVGEVAVIEYKARDGLKIPGLLTWPAGVPAAERKNLPLVVMPHGGPQAYDSVGFDWMAQFLANEGYAVLQPNFRGSAGFGQVFAMAGYGQWGRKMQDDITDGAKALSMMGWANPERVCIVGWSYGGYAALAGGALTPDMYKCVASIAGVSNLRDMLTDTRNRYGFRSASFTYWQQLIGDLDKDRDAIDAVSPSRLAEKFSAPVLLIHGEADTVVPIKQSDMMNNALRAAKKTVRFVRVAGDDHSLVENDSRRLALTELAAFLKAHIGQ
ncbi:MAG TPA: prolyl oligopeptidase family serine peptidase [Hyphomonadaceae bacterium]|nr:prolyl oligopeptidase family serine peptidase [Hyphomonadaceae bacterium]HPN06193.1 prolyl oligopeptidase family serine peptidase [Hyphomonadaceae bacterium]